MRKLNEKDRVGLGWRTEIGPSLLSNLDRLDVLEVVIDDYFRASPRKLRALQTLASQIDVIYHGVTLGLASSIPVEESRLSRLARVMDQLGPATWSEHLAFVRAGGWEIGHLAAPPRTLATIEGTIRNIARVRLIVGTSPVLENIATLIDPPGSTLTEANWTKEILTETRSGLLLDLHNLYSNAMNFGYDPFAYLEAFPLHKTELIHLSGGKWIQEPSKYQTRPDGRRLLDDHVHDVPNVVFELLERVARVANLPLTVIIERDGEYPDFKHLLDQVDRARAALEIGRATRTEPEEACFERAGI